MLEIIMWSLLAFFGTFGFVEFVRFVYTDFKSSYDDYHVVISTKNKEENIEGIIRTVMLVTNSSPMIVIDDNSSSDTKYILQRLKMVYPNINVLSIHEYMDFLNSKEC